MRSAFFLRPALALFAFAAVIAAAAGLAGFLFVSHVRAGEQLWQPLSPEVASRQDPVFFAVLCSQLGGAAALFLGGVVLARFTLKLRRQAQTALSAAGR